MILLDTNVVSEFMKPAPKQRVSDWLDSQTAETIYLSSVTVAEIARGIGVMSAGRRRSVLTSMFGTVLDAYRSHILPSDVDAARAYADLAVAARPSGRGFPVPDVYIAAIAVSRGFAVASRDASACAAAGLEVIDPWQPAS